MISKLLGADWLAQFFEYLAGERSNPFCNRVVRDAYKLVVALSFPSAPSVHRLAEPSDCSRSFPSAE
jgi:hypothetical protein